MKYKLLIMVLGALMACLVPATAQTSQEWQSTSTMRGSGSTLAPQVTAVGASEVSSVATTTSSDQAPRKPGSIKGDFYHGPESGQDSQDTSYPVGDAVLPLLAFALVFCGYIAIRRKRSQEV